MLWDNYNTLHLCPEYLLCTITLLFPMQSIWLLLDRLCSDAVDTLGVILKVRLINELHVRTDGTLANRVRVNQPQVNICELSRQ